MNESAPLFGSWIERDVLCACGCRMIVEIPVVGNPGEERCREHGARVRADYAARPCAGCRARIQARLFPPLPPTRLQRAWRRIRYGWWGLKAWLRRLAR